MLKFFFMTEIDVDSIICFRFCPLSLRRCIQRFLCPLVLGIASQTVIDLALFDPLPVVRSHFIRALSCIIHEFPLALNRVEILSPDFIRLLHDELSSSSLSVVCNDSILFYVWSFSFSNHEIFFFFYTRFFFLDGVWISSICVECISADSEFFPRNASLSRVFFNLFVKLARLISSSLVDCFKSLIFRCSLTGV